MTRVLLAALLAAPAFSQGVEAGKKQFEARCGACHGADGGGGERGPSIVETRRGRCNRQNRTLEHDQIFLADSKIT